MSSDRARLEIRGVSKAYPGVQALEGVDLHLGAGEMLALIGENGAGKSTLTKVLAGIVHPDQGEILIEGQLVEIRSVRDAQDQGIALIHQELNLADNLDVAANIVLGREPRRYGLVQEEECARIAQDALDRLGTDIKPRTRVSELSIGHQQLVEIAKALAQDARVLIMDEPTSSLTAAETVTLFDVMRDLLGRGVSIIYISHRLAEVTELAHRVCVLRDGRNVGELRGNEIEHDAMVRLMVGRDLEATVARVQDGTRDILLEVRDLIVPSSPEHALSFELRAGECVGLAGLVGAGRTELLETLFGLTPARGGSIRLAGQELVLKKPADAMAAGIALVPENRKEHGLIMGASVSHNIALASHKLRSRFGLLSAVAEDNVAARHVADLGIKTPGVGTDVGTLSGGNQQKVVLARWLELAPRVLLLDEPTRGIDVGARFEIYELLERMTKRGMAVLFVSSEMEEVLSLADRILVMHEGRLSGELAHAEFSEEAIMALATGAAHAATTRNPN